MGILGDVYDIASRVKEFDSSYYLRWNDNLKRYQVVSNKRKFVREGSCDGAPLYVMRDYGEVVFTWDVEGMAPDMRIIWKLHETDVWRYPGGPKAFYDDMVRDSEKQREKREQATNEMVEYQANERAPYILNEFEGVKVKRVHTVSKVVG